MCRQRILRNQTHGNYWRYLMKGILHRWTCYSFWLEVLQDLNPCSLKVAYKIKRFWLRLLVGQAITSLPLISREAFSSGVSNPTVWSQIRQWASNRIEWDLSGCAIRVGIYSNDHWLFLISCRGNRFDSGNGFGLLLLVTCRSTRLNSQCCSWTAASQ